MSIVDGTIPLSSHPGGTGATSATNHMVTGGKIDGFKAEQKCTLAVPEQLIDGGGIHHWVSNVYHSGGFDSVLSPALSAGKL